VELLSELDVVVDPVAVRRWVQRFSGMSSIDTEKLVDDETGYDIHASLVDWAAHFGAHRSTTR
jgi:hypothetical protein